MPGCRGSKHPSRSPAPAFNILYLERRKCVRRRFPVRARSSSCGDVLARRLSTPSARSAGCGLVLLQAQPSRLASPGGEFIGDLSTATKLHLVRDLAFERAIGGYATSRLKVAMLSSEWRNSQRCLSERHQASMSEFEKLTSI